MSNSNSVGPTNPVIAAVVDVTALIATSTGATTLEDVRKNGFVRCGVGLGLLGFSNVDKNGKWAGLDVDVCRTLAAVVFDDAWACRIIKKVDNYAESNERNVGPNTPMMLLRGINALWKHGGLHYPMPVR